MFLLNQNINSRFTFAGPVTFQLSAAESDQQMVFAVVKCQFNAADRSATLAELIVKLLTYAVHACYERMEETAYVRMLEALLAFQDSTASVSLSPNDHFALINHAL